jgi:hypothetical protein
VAVSLRAAGDQPYAAKVLFGSINIITVLGEVLLWGVSLD